MRFQQGFELIEHLVVLGVLENECVSQAVDEGNQHFFGLKRECLQSFTPESEHEPQHPPHNTFRDH